MQTPTPRDQALIKDLLERAARVLGLHVCYHDDLHLTTLPLELTQHENEACLTVKEAHQRQCAAFCGTRISAMIGGLPDGSIHTCPFGHTDLAVPVFVDEVQVGVLFASACAVGSEMPPRPGLIHAPDHQWLEDRRAVLGGLARQLGTLLHGSRALPEAASRKRTILRVIEENLDTPIRLATIATALNLSRSRTSHLIKEVFGETLPQLVRRMRLNRAARLLAITDDPLAHIAAATGFSDQSHFTRSFGTQYHMPPLAYRKKHRRGV